jgi:hypothetical protein
MTMGAGVGERKQVTRVVSCYSVKVFVEITWEELSCCSEKMSVIVMIYVAALCELCR